MRYGRLRDLVRTLRFRLTAWLTLVVLLMLVVTTVTVRAVVGRALRDEFDRLLIEDTVELGLVVRQYYPQDADQLQRALENKVQGHANRNWFVQLFASDGRRLWASDNVPALTGPAAPGPPRPRPFDEGGYRLIEARLPARDGYVLVRCGCSREPVEEDLALVDRIMLLTGLCTLLLTPVGGYALAGRATRPIAAITTTAAGLQPARLDERLALRGTGDELDQLSLTINGMLDRIASYLRQNRDLVANAAHELRSPLAAIRTTVEVALNRSRSPEEYAAVLAVVMDECGRLAGLVNRLLLLAEGDAGRLGARDHSVRLDRVVRESVEMFEAVAESKNLELRAADLDAVVVRGDEDSLRQVVRNLIDNAVKYTRPPGRVVVRLAATPDCHACLTVRDSGIGIGPDDLPRIFERFYRADKSRTREAERGGHGLGLSICQVVVAALGGEIAVDSQPGRGSTFTVRLPLLAEGEAARGWPAPP